MLSAIELSEKNISGIWIKIQNILLKNIFEINNCKMAAILFMP